jgi:hypothetical protein
MHPDWTQAEHQHFLNLIRGHWRGWNIVLFEDRASQHTAPGSLWMAGACAIEVRLLPRATPELNAMENSGSDLGPLRKLVDSVPHSKQIEFFQFVSDCDPALGKGYSEFHMLDRVVAKSELLQESDRLWKVTGRLKVLNIDRMMATAPIGFSCYCDLRSEPLIGHSLGGNYWMETRLFACSLPGYQE